MCLQDLQIARSISIESIDFVTTGAGPEDFLPPDESRVGVLITGPNTGNLDILATTTASRAALARYQVTTSPEQRILSIWTHGPIVTQRLYLVASVVNQFRCFVYTLPMDHPLLTKLATYGKFGK